MSFIRDELVRELRADSCEDVIRSCHGDEELDRVKKGKRLVWLQK